LESRNKFGRSIEATDRAKRKYYEKHRNEVIARAQARPLEEQRKHKAAWKVRNKDWVRADTKFRRCKHKLATPKWLTDEDKKAMKKLYETAIVLTRTTGIPHVVDHDIPLRGKLVSGLHILSNLHVIPRKENLLKSNRFQE